MKRLGWFAGALTAVGVAVLVVPSGSAESSAEYRVPAGLKAGDTVFATSSAGRSADDDVPDIEWPPPGVTPPKHSAEKLREFAAAMQQRLEVVFPEVVPEAKDLTWQEWVDGDEGPDRDEVALTVEQLTALATDPELHL